MIHSMTGFGEAQLEDGGQTYHVELRSFNQRYLKAAIHLPDELSFLEPEVERVLRERLSRGSITFRLHVRRQDSGAALELNTSAVKAYVEQLRAALGEDARVTIDLATLLTLPGVCQPRDVSEEERDSQWRLIERLTREALARLVAMRAAEGKALASDLSGHCALIRRALGEVRRLAPLTLEQYRDRLMARVGELLAGSNVALARDDLLREVSIYAERSDISEELSRLSGHLDQFALLMQADEPAGRKLEFVAQEMLREANTMGSKTGDAEIARQIIDIKSAVDRIKEQVQNAE